MIAIVKYNAGNITSVKNAIERLGFECIVTDDSNELEKADKVIFPGVGEASSAMEYLKEKGLDEVIKNLKQPFLGICLGMQLMCDYSEEGNVDCLGIFKTNVKKFPPLDLVPQMGWNTIVQNGKENENEDVYFVHSYYAVPENPAHVLAETDYGGLFCCAAGRDNIFATQFHPEKSATAGLQLYKNFVHWNP